MRVMVMIKANKESESNAMPSTEMLAAMGKYNEELVKAGIMTGGEGLLSSAHGKRVRFLGDKRTVLDGPFSESKELLAGFWLWKVKSMDEAVEWVKRVPTIGADPKEGFEIEIRQIASEEDFGETFTPELREKEARLRDQLAAQQR